MRRVFLSHEQALCWLKEQAQAHAANRLWWSQQRSASPSRLDSLCVLYCKVPGWPLGFGDKAKAKELLQKALNAPPRPGRQIADASRRDEIRALLA